MRKGVTIVLSHDWPRMTSPMRQRVESLIAGGCTGWECDGGNVTLTRRKLQNQTVQVHLQCDGCGRSVSGALARGEHHAWQSYREWDESHEFAREAERLERIAEADERRERLQPFPNLEEVWQRRRAEYAEWCRTSPEWGHIRGLVARRAGGICEACLQGPVQQVHHLTYEFGKLPPAWELRGVCLPCHRKLHADVHGDSDPWCPRSLRELLK